MLQFAVVAVLLALALGFAHLMSRALRQESTGAPDRRRQFVFAYDGAGIPFELLEQVHDQLARRVTPPGRRVLPSARLAADLGLSETDVEDVAVLVLARTQGRVPAVRDLDRLDLTVRTVDDLVRLLAELHAGATIA